MQNRYIVLRFGNRRVVLLSRNGESATMTQHYPDNHLTFDYSSCDLIGSVIVPENSEEPDLGQLLDFITKGYAPGLNVPLGYSPAPLGTATGGLLLES